MNETLEAMARALFQSWFVDFDPVRAKAAGRQPAGMDAATAALFPDSFEQSELGVIPRGWEVKPLGSLYQLGIGGVWGLDAAAEKAPIRVRCLRGIDLFNLAIGRLPDAPERWLSRRQLDARELMGGEILVEGSGSFCGRSLLYSTVFDDLFDSPVCYSNFCKRLDPICDPIQGPTVWMQLVSAYLSGQIGSFRTGTAFPNLDVNGLLENVWIVVPPDPIAQRFAHFFQLTKRTDLWEQSRVLAEVRDSLLPALLAGEDRARDQIDVALAMVNN